MSPDPHDRESQNYTSMTHQTQKLDNVSNKSPHGGRDSMMLKTLGSPLLQQRIPREAESNDYGTRPIDVAG